MQIIEHVNFWSVGYTLLSHCSNNSYYVYQQQKILMDSNLRWTHPTNTKLLKTHKLNTGMTANIRSKIILTMYSYGGEQLNYQISAPPILVDREDIYCSA